MSRPGLDLELHARDAADRGADRRDRRPSSSRCKNEGRAPSTGIADLQRPARPGRRLFVKLKCFCFDEQTLKPGETMDFPVVFYIDPTIAKDRNLDDLSSITLSYTYFASRNGQPVASAARASRRETDARGTARPTADKTRRPAYDGSSASR